MLTAKVMKLDGGIGLAAFLRGFRPPNDHDDPHDDVAHTISPPYKFVLFVKYN